MNFAYNYIDNYNKLRDVLLDDAIFSITKRNDITNVQVEQATYRNKTVSSYFIEGDEKPFCKVEHSKKGIYFFKAKETIFST